MRGYGEEDSSVKNWNDHIGRGRDGTRSDASKDEQHVSPLKVPKKKKKNEIGMTDPFVRP